MTSRYAIIVAGGVGSRSGDSIPKQFHDLGGHPMLWWTIKAFHD
ncbi:MAG: 2-C-methyl-D-erythritol 4-phosphate cytidylyltransferase [Muribaculaceae bacterium]|nr:2-C-methyl-D-erythritol 4-phosphate cytidylyltransferase [Muribaculaceae bacterium]